MCFDVPVEAAGGLRLEVALRALLPLNIEVVRVWSVGATLPIHHSRGVAAFILVDFSFQSIFTVILKVFLPQFLFH